MNIIVKRDFPTPPTMSNIVRNQVYIDMGDVPEEEKRRFGMFNFFQKIFLYTPTSRSDPSGQYIMGCKTSPDRIKWKLFQQGLLFEFVTTGGPPFRMYLQLAQMFPNYRFYTKADGFSNCSYHGKECFYFGEGNNTRDCTMGVGHFGEGCDRRDRSVLPFQYPMKK